MPKGFFTQSVVVLFRRPPPIEDVRALLERGHTVAKQVPANEQWQLNGPAVIVRYRDEVNGLVAVDSVDRPWPDGMGDPQADPFLFAAWGMGYFGPLTFPGGLRRAVEQAWGWSKARELVQTHAAFVRMTLSYVFGAGPEAPVMPDDCDPVDELEFLNGLARAVLDHPGAICAFNPGGELVLDAEELDARLESGRRHAVPALDAWCNVRLFKRDDAWLLMDTVGNGQLDLPDVEAAFPSERFAPPEVEAFLRKVSLYSLTSGDVVKNGDTMDGPGGMQWQAWTFEEPLVSPPRRVLRWIPIRPEEERRQDPVPLALLPAEEAARRADAARKPWWKRWLSSSA